jgi:hypothetical protein
LSPDILHIHDRSDAQREALLRIEMETLITYPVAVQSREGAVLTLGQGPVRNGTVLSILAKPKRKHTGYLNILSRSSGCIVVY